jgi:hypothetical protein
MGAVVNLLEAFVMRGRAAQEAVDQVLVEPAATGPRTRASTINPTRFINAAAVRELALETAQALRPFSHLDRVSESFLVDISEEVRRSVIGRIKRHPSKGHTIK